ncbi:MAG: ClpP family protease [Faecousia sp.]
MQIIKKSSSGIQSLPLDAMLLAQRKVFLSEAITTKSANAVLQQLLFLEGEDSNAPIKLIIDSPGGEVNAGLMLYDQIKGMDVPIEMYCTELAASMAAVILAGGRPGHRFILKHSKVMIHEPLISSSSGGICGSASSIAKTAESILETKRVMTELLAQDTGRTIEEIEKAVSFDNFMNAEEAVTFGICDSIVDRV